MFVSFARRRQVWPVSFVRNASSSSSSQLKRTALYELHKKHGGKMVPFCGWEMPVQYPDGVLKSHLHTRESSSLFDVSHMAQLHLRGKDRVEFIEKLVVGDIKELPVHQGTLSLFTNEKGGIIDDTIINKYEDHLFIVVNAGCAEKDIAHLKDHLSTFVANGGDVQLEVLPFSLLALQGPKSATVLSRLIGSSLDVSKLNFMTGRKDIPIAGIPCRITRCGYTGEDGFEISVSPDKAVQLAEKLLGESEVKPAGLAARDSLRLEAGLCLYGNDITEETSPVEAALSWTIGKRRKEQGGFLGSEIILPQLKTGVDRKRVGLLVEGVIAREHTHVYPNEGQELIGEVTSGTFSPSLKRGIAMAYVRGKQNHKLNSKLKVQVRGSLHNAVVAKMPFQPTNYYKAP